MTVWERGSLYKSNIIFCVLHQLNERIWKLTEQFERTGALLILYVVTEENLEEYRRQGNERRQVMAVSAWGELEGRL